MFCFYVGIAIEENNLVCVLLMICKNYIHYIYLIQKIQNNMYCIFGINGFLVFIEVLWVHYFKHVF